MTQQATRAGSDGRGTIDWGIGQYERFAAEIEPAAQHVVELAEVSAGERVLDVACGTGNAALLAARAGGVVSGLDAAPRLIEVARQRAAAAGVDASFSVGDLHNLGFEDEAFDVVLSVFGVIFAADPERALAEIVRVLRPGGRALLSVWVPTGPVDAMVGVFIRAVAEVMGSTGGPRFAWHDPEAVGGVAARHGADVDVFEGAIEFVAESPEAYLAVNEAHHPMSIAGGAVLQRAGTAAATREQALRILRDGNEESGGFRVTSNYRVMRTRRPAAGHDATN
jgi:SAM-dependent methyltransferase